MFYISDKIHYICVNLNFSDSIDFEKAFDTVSWKFISKRLDYFYFGESIKRWIHIFQKGAETSILQNGFMSEFFLLKRGCRQGDLLPPYIFL